MIFLDKNNNAEGRLYLDDFKSYNHRNGDEYAYFKIKLNNMKTLEYINVNENTFNFINNKIEFIYIFGVDEDIVKQLYEINPNNDKNQIIEFSYENNMLTLLNVNIDTLSNFTLNFNYSSEKFLIK